MAHEIPLSKKVIAEALGTFFLVFIGVSSIIAATSLSIGNGVMQLTAIALAHGLALAIAVTVAMSISGGHINPAVTLGFLAARRIKIADALAYIAAQVAGAAVAGFIAFAIVPGALAASAGYGIPAVSNSITIGQAMIAEAVITFFLMIAVYGTAVDKRAPHIGGFGIGLALVADILAVGPFTGAAANPARALGPAIAAMNFTNWYVYWIGPVIGAVIAALFYEYLIIGKKT